MTVLVRCNERPSFRMPSVEKRSFWPRSYRKSTCNDASTNNPTLSSSPCFNFAPKAFSTFARVHGGRVHFWLAFLTPPRWRCCAFLRTGGRGGITCFVPCDTGVWQFGVVPPISLSLSLFSWRIYSDGREDQSGSHAPTVDHAQTTEGPAFGGTRARWGAEQACGEVRLRLGERRRGQGLCAYSAVVVAVLRSGVGPRQAKVLRAPGATDG